MLEFIVIRNESEEFLFERHHLNFRSLLPLGCENIAISFGVTPTESKSAINLPRIGCSTHLDYKAKLFYHAAACSPSEESPSPHTNHRGCSAPPLPLPPRVSLDAASAKKKTKKPCLLFMFIITPCRLFASSFHGWTGSNLELLHETSALPSTLKQIPLSLTQPSTLMRARGEARAHTYSNCHCNHPHGKH